MAAGKPVEHVHVLYDYDYVNQDGKKVSIRVDEEYRLIKKTSQEWWYVVPKNGSKADAFYVPASYVEVLHKTVIDLGDKPAVAGKPKKPPPRPPKPKTMQPKITDEEEVLKQLDDLTDLLESEYQTLGSFNGNVDIRKNENEKSDSSSGDHISSSKNSLERLNTTSTTNSADNDLDTQVKIDANSNVQQLPDYANLEDVRKSIGPQLLPDDQPTYQNISELRDSMSSLPSGEPPQPTPDEKPSLDLGDGWGLYRDPQTKKQYYHNKDLLESSWRPPANIGGAGNKDTQGNKETKGNINGNKEPSPNQQPPPPPIRVNSFGTSILLSSTDSSEDLIQVNKRLSNLSIRSSGSGSAPPVGWRENTNDSGDVFFINDATNEKWHSSIDDRGRPYYYREGSIGDSAWELPQSPTQLREVKEEFGAVGGEEEMDGVTKDDKMARLSPNLSASRESTDQEQEGKEDDEEEEEEENTSSASASASASASGNTSVDLDMRVPPPSAVKRPTEKRGILNRTKIQESGKKCKKNWTSSYVLVSGGQLCMYKDHKGATKEKSPPVKPDIVIDLVGCQVDTNTKQKSSKKYLLQLMTDTGSEYLLQAQDNEQRDQWFVSIRNNIRFKPPTASTPTHGGSQRSLDQYSDDGKSPKRDKRGLESPDDTLSNPVSNTKIRERLLRWLFTRPSMGDLEKKGFIKDRVFGGTVQSLANRDGCLVPQFLTQCTAAIEKRGLAQDGIYRVSGNMAQVQKLRLLVDSGEPYDLDSPEWEMHVLTGALKLFFRELKEPVFPFNMFDAFISAISKLQDRNKRLKAMKSLIKELPAPNRETLNVLLQHLIKVVSYSSENRMQAQNVAIVFGPTLMWPEVESSNIAVSMVYQGQLVEFLIQEYTHLF